MSSMPRFNRKEFTKWKAQIDKRRAENCGKSIARYPFALCRVKMLCGSNVFKEVSDEGKGRASKASVVYWMNRDQRVQDNWALLFAQRIAIKFSVPLNICFNLPSSSAIRTRRQVNFLLEGLAEVERECRDLNIGFFLLFGPTTKLKTAVKRHVDGEPAINGDDCEKLRPLLDYLTRAEAKVVVTDFSPLREDLNFVKILQKLISDDVSFYQVDSHNIVPTWFASERLEYCTITIHPFTKHQKPVDWTGVRRFLKGRVDESVESVEWCKGGSEAGFIQLFNFLHNRLSSYAKDRNNPLKNAFSNLSPWLHFGHISAQRCIWEARSFERSFEESVGAFIDAAFIRRELADNFCFYNNLYDSFQGAWTWAQETLKKHSLDVRQPSYSEEEMESASTGDELWNAAQRQLLREGKIPCYLRRYWAKKILEWHGGGPEKALQLGLRLNDKYSLDGTDPAGYAGVMCSICGVHGYKSRERPVFGKILFMNFAGCKAKFDVAAYIKKYPK